MTGENKQEKLESMAQDELHRGLVDGFQLLPGTEDGSFHILDSKGEIWTEMQLHYNVFGRLNRWRKAFRMGWEQATLVSGLAHVIQKECSHGEDVKTGTGTAEETGSAVRTETGI